MSSTDDLIKTVEKEIEKGLNSLFSPMDDDDEYHKQRRDQNPYINAEKSSVLQSARDFHDSNIVREKPDEVVTTITQLLYLQNSNRKRNLNLNTYSNKHHSNTTAGSISNYDSRLTEIEATDVFFGVTKLFVSTNHRLLRRMVYVILKDLISLCQPSDIIIITSCLTKDMTCNDYIYRSNALRVLARIIDTSMLSAIERYIKQAILESSTGGISGSNITISRNSQTTISSPNTSFSSSTIMTKQSHQRGLVSSAALVSSLHLLLQSNENAMIVKRWINEVYEALRSSGFSGNLDMVQFHALILYYQMKKSDRLAISKFVQTFCNSTMNRMERSINKGRNYRNSVSIDDSSSNIPSLNSPLAITCLIRYTCKLLLEEVIEGRISSFTHSSSSSELCAIGYQFLKSCLRHESEMVTFEAASSICSLSTATTSDNESDNAASLEDILPALSVLQLLLSSQKPAARLGTIKLLYKLSIKYPQFISGRFNDSLEASIGDSNRLIGTLSIMTLIKTFSGSANSKGDNNIAIDRLLKHISSFISYIADEYKIMVIKSLEQLCVAFPMKSSVIISFLSKFLREDGGFSFKETIVHSIGYLIEAVPESKDLALLYLCEFIEDCEYVMLSTLILTMIGNLGPTTTSPARYVRFIYNRCILENAMIRSASILALSKIGASCPSLRSSILVLLKSCLMDDSDEVRDRVILAISVLEDAEMQCPYDPTIEDDENNNDAKHDKEENPAVFLLINKLPCSFDLLEKRLKVYKTTPGAMESIDLLCLSNLPEVEDEPIEPEISNKQEGIIDSVISRQSQKITNSADSSSAISNIPEFAAFGHVFLSSKPFPLTETETEYVVYCIKHIYDNHVILQFITQNTIEDQRLENVSVSVENDSEAYVITGELPAQSISYGSSASCFTVLERKSTSVIEACVLNCELKFSVIQVDPSTGEDEGESYEEEYPLEDTEILITDFISKAVVPDFRGSWESIGSDNEILQKFSLQESDLGSAVKAVIDCLGLQTCDGTHAIKSGARQHMLHLCGTFLGGVVIVARSQVSIAPSGSTILKIAIRSEDAQVSKLIAGCLG